MLAKVGNAWAHNLLSTHEVAANKGRPLKYIAIYCVQILYYLTLGMGLRGWWLVALLRDTSVRERSIKNYINNLYAFIYIKSGALTSFLSPHHSTC
jgi:hypothetical protein